MRMTRPIHMLHVLGLLAFASPVFATPQMLDGLRYKGEDRAIFYVMPLEDQITPEVRTKWFNHTSTACWRGYVALWEIDDQYLVLREVKACGPGFWDFTSVPLSVISPDWTNRVRATWFSGTFETPIWYSQKGSGLPIFIARQFCIEQGRLTSASVIFPVLAPLRPYLFTIPVLIAVIVLGSLLYRLRRAHNKPAQATGKPAPAR